MADDEDKASEYRRQAADCLEVAERMSRHQDRALMLRLAQRWLQLAEAVSAAPAVEQAPGVRRKR